MLYHLMKEGERSATRRAPEPRLIPAPLPEDWQEGDELPEPIVDPRPDEERVLDGNPGYTVAFTLARDLEAFESVDEEAGEIVLDVAALDAHLHALIDRGAGLFRQRFITTVPGQEMTYLRKEAEARAVVAGDEAGPMLSAEAAATDADVAELAASVVAQADAWLQLGALIEGARIAAKRAVTAAGTEADKWAASDVYWEGLVAPQS